MASFISYAIAFFLPLASFVGGSFFLYLGMQRYLLLQRISQSAPSGTSGLALVSGVVDSEREIGSHISKTPCAFSRIVVEKLNPGTNNWEHLFVLEKQGSFSIKANAERTNLAPAGADLYVSPNYVFDVRLLMSQTNFSNPLRIVGFRSRPTAKSESVSPTKALLSFIGGVASFLSRQPAMQKAKETKPEEDDRPLKFLQEDPEARTALEQAMLRLIKKDVEAKKKLERLLDKCLEAYDGNKEGADGLKLEIQRLKKNFSFAKSIHDGLRISEYVLAQGQEISAAGEIHPPAEKTARPTIRSGLITPLLIAANEQDLVTVQLKPGIYRAFFAGALLCLFAIILGAFLLFLL